MEHTDPIKEVLFTTNLQKIQALLIQITQATVILHIIQVTPIRITTVVLIRIIRVVPIRILAVEMEEIQVVVEVMVINKVKLKITT